MNKSSRKPIPYVTVALLNENKGINADSMGRFVLFSNKQNSSDTLAFSSIGYNSIKYSARDFKSDTVELSEKTTVLPEIIVENKQSWTFEYLNAFDEKRPSAFYAVSNYHKQVAQPFETKEAFGILSSVKIACVGINARFRLRIYNTDGKGEPSSDLCTEVIEVVTRGRATLEINLDKYNIALPQKHFFVAVEWIKNDENAGIPAKAHKDPAFQIFQPMIAFIKEPNQLESAWGLDYRNEWKIIENYNAQINLFISATVKY